MAYEHKPGSFTLFKNDKGDNDRRPDYRGEGKDEAGNDIEVAGWIRKSDKGSFLSCTMKAKQAAQKPQQSAPKQTGGGFDDLETIPF